MSLDITFNELFSIAKLLATGLQELSKQVEEQQKTEQKLRLRLERVSEKYEVETITDSSSIEFSDWRDEIVKQIGPSRKIGSSEQADAFRPSRTANANIQKAHNALIRLNEIKMTPRDNIRKCPVAHKSTDQEDFERDFTTNGKPGNLECPFAQTADQIPLCGTDPIAAEFHGDRSSTRSPDAGESRCPIRFLDKHSPEEIAQYFENHKHEIPRSHEICVKRYQANEHSIRQLDAKYGNLVSMIQGLGTKHKQYLPEDEKVADMPSSDSNKAVEKWAENISQHSEPVPDERVPRFEQPLRDIRVGESPSRPWGIQIPVDHSPPASAAPSVNEAEKSSKLATSVAGLAPDPVPEPIPASIPEAKLKQPEAMATKPSIPADQHRPSQIVFNGPVFFGYSAEQAALFLQNLSLGTK